MKPNQKMTDKDGNQVLLYPAPMVAITQSANGTISHMGTISMDDNQNSQGISQFYAPCDLIVVGHMPTWAENPVIFQSLAPVRTVDGDLTYITIRTMHQDNISNLPIGKTFRQGEPWVLEGNAGVSTGNHVHYEIVKGQKNVGDIKRSPQGKYSMGLVGQDVTADYLLAVNDTQIINSSYTGIKMNWRTYDGQTGGGGSDDPKPTEELVLVVKDSNIRKEFNMGDKYEVTSIKGDQVILTKIKSKPALNEYGQAVFEGSEIEFSMIYNKANKGSGKAPYYKNSKGRGYGKVLKVLSGVDAPYTVSIDGKSVIGFVKPVNTY